LFAGDQQRYALFKESVFRDMRMSVGHSFSISPEGFVRHNATTLQNVRYIICQRAYKSNAITWGVILSISSATCACWALKTKFCYIRHRPKYRILYGFFYQDCPSNKLHPTHGAEYKCPERWLLFNNRKHQWFLETDAILLYFGKNFILKRLCV